MSRKKKRMRPLTEAQKKLVEENVGLIGYVIKKKGRKEATARDEMQDGVITLMKSVKGFRKKKGARFSTYATHAVTNELIRKRYEDGVIRVPEYLNTKKYENSRFQANAQVARSMLSIDVAVDVDDHPIDPGDDEAEFGYRAMRAVRWAVQKLPPIERDVVRGVVFRGDSTRRLGIKHGISMKNVEAFKLQAFAKLRTSLQKYV